MSSEASRLANGSSIVHKLFNRPAIVASGLRSQAVRAKPYYFDVNAFHYESGELDQDKNRPKLLFAIGEEISSCVAQRIRSRTGRIVGRPDRTFIENAPAAVEHDVLAT